MIDGFDRFAGRQRFLARAVLHGQWARLKIKNVGLGRFEAVRTRRNTRIANNTGRDRDGVGAASIGIGTRLMTAQAWCAGEALRTSIRNRCTLAKTIKGR